VTKSETKSGLRTQAIGRRGKVGERAREAFAARIAVEGVQIARRACARTVAAFWPIGAEADTRALVAALAYHQFITCLPVTPARGNPLVFRRWRPGQPMVEGPMGLFEPAPSAPPARPDVVFAPLAAFDRRGFRIGYGAGYYDITLARLRAEGLGPAVGIAFACQEIPRVPEEAHDQPLDYILTETELIDCSLAWT